MLRHEQKPFWSGLVACTLFSTTAIAETESGQFQTPPSSGKSKADGRFTTDEGHHLSYGVDLALLRISAARRPDEPGRLRHYEAKIDTLPGEFGFFVAWSPSGQPWRLTNRDSHHLQLMSPTAFALFGPTSPAIQSSFSLGVGMGFFDRILMLGVSFDLYRGMPTLSPDGTSGGSTAETGLIAWSLMSHGEVTPENIAFIASLSLGSVIQKFSGAGQ